MNQSMFVLILIILKNIKCSSDDFSTDSCPYLSLMSSSEDSIIYANIYSSKIFITYQSDINGRKCEINFDESSICGLSIGKYQNKSKQWFIYWGYDDYKDLYYIKTVNYSLINSKKCLYNSTDKIHLSTNSPIFKMLNDGSLAYGFDYNYFYSYIPQMNILNKIISNQGNLRLTPSDLSISQSGNEVIALGYLQNIQQMFASICLWNVNISNSSLIITDCQILDDNPYHFNEYHPGPKLSIDINNNLIAIGNSANRTIEIFIFNETDLMKEHSYKSNIETNSICWLNDGHRIATVAHLVSTSPWSQSQIQIYDLNSMNSNRPEYVFPNSQQQLDSWNYQNPSFILISMWKQWDSLVIQMDTQKVLILLSTDSGSHPDPLLYSWFDNPWIWIGLRNRRLNEQSSTPCWPGMSKQENNILLCDICPPNTKSTTNSSVCNPCNPSLFCPLGSPDEIDISNMIDIHHIMNYPPKSNAPNYEDILLTNMFSIGNSVHCVVISPLFWMLIVILIIALFLLAVGMMKFFPSSHKHRVLIKKIFRQTDVIGEGELWIGGLMSFSLFVLVIFAFLFSNEYSNLYPIEESSHPTIACDEDLRNAQFDSGLQLLLATRTDEDQIIFDMLDNQAFILTIQFVNTHFNCDLLSILQGTGQNLHEPIEPLTCFQNNTNEIIFTSISAPHEVTFIYKINHFAPIGGIYICLTGSGNTTNDGWNSIRDFHFCKFISHENETIGYSPEIKLLNTKVNFIIIISISNNHLFFR